MDSYLVSWLTLTVNIDNESATTFLLTWIYYMYIPHSAIMSLHTNTLFVLKKYMKVFNYHYIYLIVVQLI